MARNKKYYSEEQVLRLIHDGAAKCRKNIEMSTSEDHIDGAIGMCNVLSNVVCKILNNADYKFIGPRWNIHRKWCSRAFNLLQAEISELDARITIKKEEISNDADNDGRIGFNS